MKNYLTSIATASASALALALGNERFTAGTSTKRDHSKMVRDAANGQFAQ